MTSIGTGYDLSASTYSPEGRLFQVEYASKAVDGSGTALGIKCSDGRIVLAVEKPRPSTAASKLLKPEVNRRVEVVDASAAVVGAGLQGDCHHLAIRAREEASEFKRTFGGMTMPPAHLADRLGQYVQAHTLYSSVRPFGCSLLVASSAHGGEAGLYMIEPSGLVHGYRAAACGRARQHVRTELEKLVASGASVSSEQAVKEAIRCLVAARQEDPSAREKDVELEVAVVGQGTVRFVPLQEVEAHAAAALDVINAAMEFEEVQ